VEAEIKGRLSDKVFVDFPYKWAGVDYSKQIKNIKLNHPKGKIKFKKHNSNYAVITIPKTDSIGLSYEIYQKPGNPAHVHETIVRKDLVHTTGYGVFATPNELKDTEDKKVEVSITWKNIPKEWKTLSSYGTDESLRFTTSVPQLLHALYVAGNLRIYQIGDSHDQVYLSLYGNFDWKDDLIISDISEIIKTQRSFFNDHDFPYYAISLIEGDDPNSLGGTGLHNSFTMYIPKGKGRLIYYTYLAHEHFHTWVGGKIHNNEQEELNYWWSEGFTDYYSRVLALRSGGLSIEEFIDECNQFLRSYYLSPVLNESNEKIKQDFWKNYDVGKLPYYRGFVFAIYLNCLIKENNPDNSLDNVILDLFKDAQHKKFSVGYFKNIIKKYIPQGIAEEISTFIDHGKTIELNDVVMFLPLEKTVMGSYDVGFIKQAAPKEKFIKKIDKKSNAYKAGLRDGDKVIAWSVPKGYDPDQIITIKTTNKTFEFRPESPDKKKLYQFKSNLFTEDKIKIKKFFGVGSK
jgi:predicted metalloprotease with PDZ domain